MRSERKPVDPTVQAARITRRGTLITALATVIAALIAGVFAAYKVGNDQGAADAPTVTVTATKTANAAPPTSTGAAAQASEVSSQVRLEAGSGVDIDAADPRAVETSGPNGDVDVYFGDPSVLVTRSAMYYYYGGEDAARAGCPKAVANDRPAPGGGILLSAGSQFCLRTSEGKVGWVGCNDVKISSDRTGYIVLNYRLFTTT